MYIKNNGKGDSSGSIIFGDNLKQNINIIGNTFITGNTFVHSSLLFQVLINLIH